MVLLGVELLYFRVADHFNIIDKAEREEFSHENHVAGRGIVFAMGGVLVYFIASEFSFPWFMIDVDCRGEFCG